MKPLPDKLSIETESPFYDECYKRVGVRVDGKIINNCVEYNVAERWVRRTVRDSKGKIKKERGRIVAIMQKNVTVEPYWI
jgi:hypothetical protein